MAVWESGLGAVARVGPYFTAVSLIPSAVLAAGLYVLVSTEPWTGSPDWTKAVPSESSWQGLLVWALLAAFLALLFHPLQYSVVQVLEGYWGSGPFALWLARGRLQVWLARYELLQKRSVAGQTAFEELQSQTATKDSLAAKWSQFEADRQLQDLPALDGDLMPTRLGNILRGHEERAGRPYGLGAISAIPHVGLLAPPEQLAYLNDQRTQLDLAVRLCFTTGVLGVATLALFSFCGYWAMLALVPLGLSALLYRGACTVAHHYGNAIEVLIDLNRYRLYEALGLDRPEGLEQERAQNVGLSRLLQERAEDCLIDKVANTPNADPWWKRARLTVPGLSKGKQET